jgi:hypothetical protein
MVPTAINKAKLPCALTANMSARVLGRSAASSARRCTCSELLAVRARRYELERSSRGDVVHAKYKTNCVLQRQLAIRRSVCW